jgi:hypothetical protein
MAQYLTKAQRDVRAADRRRIYEREQALGDAIKASGHTNPLTEPNGTHAALWRLAQHLRLASAEEVDEAYRVIGDLWSYTGD